MSEDDKGFEVRDKRKTYKEGDAVDEPKEENTENREGPGPKPEGSEGSVGGSRGASEGLPPIDFPAFIGSLAATTLMHLGEKIAPDQPEGHKDLASAKQMIDLIELLKEKTKGNLEKGEEQMMENLLYNLRVRYVAEVNRK